MSGSVLWWYKEFLDRVGHDKAFFVMHTDPKDPHGQDLEVIAREVGLTRDNFALSVSKVPPTELAKLYNAADCTINISDAEGVGMATIESMACGKPVIVNMTGGLQEQVIDDEGNWLGIGIAPASKAIIGSQEVPYIYEDRVSKEGFIDAMVKMHNMTKEEREEMGKKARNFVLKKYDLEHFAKAWEQTMDKFIEDHGSWQERKNYNHWTLKEF
jgi:glycosyltransferase involved in cell wall biosynthesis